MKKYVGIIIFINVILVVIALAGCNSLKFAPQQEGPEDVYWEYWDLCNSGKYSQAELLLTEKGKNIAKNSGWGICSFTHDFVYKAHLYPGAQERLPEFSEVKPDVHISEGAATLTWIPVDGSLTQILTFNFVDGEWKINELFTMD